MFVLIESSRVTNAAEGLAGRALSLGIHAALIATAVLATRTAAKVVEEGVAPPIDLRWQTPAPRAAAEPGAPVSTPMVPRPVALAIPTVPVDPALPPPHPGLTSDPPPAAQPGTLFSDSARVPGGTAIHATFQPAEVDVLPVLIDHPPLEYPALLRQAGIEGRVVIEAVLDTAGRAEPASLRVAGRDLEPFERAARAAVLASRYRPARMAGRAVRVRVLVPIAFTIRR